MKRFTKEQAVMLHEILLDKTGGLRGLRDERLLESALNNPFQTFGGEELYPDVFHKAAQLCFSILKNHPFIDGNKRIGILAMLVFLKINGVYADFTDEELASLGWGTADGSINYRDILKFLLNKAV